VDAALNVMQAADRLLQQNLPRADLELGAALAQ
jgi:hypothetical protein